MPTLLLNGSPREGGNTEILLNRVLDGIRAAGGEAELLHLCRMRIAPCMACDFCKTAPRCAIEDDMAELYPKLTAARHLVIGSPIYFHGLPAQAKAFVDRCQFFWNRRPAADENTPRRFGHFIAVAATHGASALSAASASTDRISGLSTHAASGPSHIAIAFTGSIPAVILIAG